MAHFNQQYIPTVPFNNEDQWAQVVLSIIAVFIVLGWLV